MANLLPRGISASVTSENDGQSVGRNSARTRGLFWSGAGLS